MTEQELLERVKEMTNYTSEYHNNFLSGWINEAKGILANSGVNDTYLDGDCSGIVSLIITDIVDNGGASLFNDDSLLNKRISQLAITYPRKEV